MPGRTTIGKIPGQRGFTRWAVLVALIIVGVLAFAVGPRLLGEVTVKEIATAKAQVAELGKAVEQ
ncbi:MAG: ral secretion pathway protein, partial [Pseudomonas sp.]|nr:ral secretion pathway protein [Pseudomonas sp.]